MERGRLVPRRRRVGGVGRHRVDRVAPLARSAARRRARRELQAADASASRHASPSRSSPTTCRSRAASSLSQDLATKNVTLLFGYGTATTSPVAPIRRSPSSRARVDHDALKAGAHARRRSARRSLALVGDAMLRERRPVEAVSLHPDVRAGHARSVHGASIDQVNALAPPRARRSSSSRSRAQRFALTGRLAHRFDDVDASPRRAPLRRHLGAHRVDDRRALPRRRRASASRSGRTLRFHAQIAGELLAARVRPRARASISPRSAPAIASSARSSTTTVGGSARIGFGPSRSDAVDARDSISTPCTRGTSTICTSTDRASRPSAACRSEPSYERARSRLVDRDRGARCAASSCNPVLSDQKSALGDEVARRARRSAPSRRTTVHRLPRRRRRRSPRVQRRGHGVSRRDVDHRAQRRHRDARRCERRHVFDDHERGRQLLRRSHATSIPSTR